MKLLLLNPKRKSTVKKGKTMARRKHTKRKIRRNPAPAALVARRPSRRRRIARSVVAVAKRAGRVVRRRVRSLRARTGGGSLVNNAKHTVMNGAVAGLGAVGADIIAAQLMQFLPDNLKTGPMQQVAQAAVSLIAGFAVSKVNKTAGEAVAMGGITVATYNLTKSLLKSSGIPGMAGYYDLQGYDYNPSYGMGSYNDSLRSVSSSNPLSEYASQMNPNAGFDSGFDVANGLSEYDPSYSFN